MKTSISLLNSLVSDIVDLKMIKENQLKIEKTLFNPFIPLKFVKDLFKHARKNNDVDLSLKFIQGRLLRSIKCIKYYHQLDERPLPDRLIGDEVRFKQVLINLVKNAIKFTNEGYIRILAGYDHSYGLMRVHI